MAIDELEKKLRPPEVQLAPYPSKVITLASGELMVVRECRREEAGVLLGTVYPLIGVAKDLLRHRRRAHVQRDPRVVPLPHLERVRPGRLDQRRDRGHRHEPPRRPEARHEPPHP